MSKIEFGKAKDATLGQCCQEDEKLGRWKRSPKRKSFSNLFSIPPDSGVCTDFIAGVKRPFMPRDPSWIFCLWEHPSSRHLLYYGEPSPSQLNEIKINQRYEKSTSPKTISAAEVLRLMVYGRVYSQWHRSLNHSSGLIVPQISRYRQSGWLEVLLGEHCEKAGGRNRALRRFRRLIPTAIEASRPWKCKYGGEVIFLI